MVEAKDAGPAPSVVRLACGWGLACDMGAKGVHGERNERAWVVAQQRQLIECVNDVVHALFSEGPSRREGLRWSVARARLLVSAQHSCRPLTAGRASRTRAIDTGRCGVACCGRLLAPTPCTWTGATDRGVDHCCSVAVAHVYGPTLHSRTGTSTEVAGFVAGPQAVTRIDLLRH